MGGGGGGGGGKNFQLALQNHLPLFSPVFFFLWDLFWTLRRTNVLLPAWPQDFIRQRCLDLICSLCGLMGALLSASMLCGGQTVSEDTAAQF